MIQPTTPAIFISFSGNRSRAFSRWLYRWLRKAMPGTVAYFADEPHPGVDWLGHILESMAECNWVIACVTEDNVNSAWINFELGLASSGDRDDRYIIILTLGIIPNDLPFPMRLMGAFEFSQERITSVFGVIARTTSFDKSVVEQFVSEHWAEMLNEATPFLTGSDYPSAPMAQSEFSR
nr:toll/interleukin-1 receptor domain-containing protein [uncultured Albidiferax sp.]